MRLKLSLSKSLQQNASDYFGRGKAAKKKLEGLAEAESAIRDRIAALEKKTLGLSAESGRLVPSRKRKKEWFEAFHWFFSSDNFLVIGGRDAKSNETAIKKHMLPADVFFHAEVFGAPHCIVKCESGNAPRQTLEEAAIFAASFSKAWEQKLSSVDVYSASPEQVSKSAKSGESIGKGAFMVYGDRQWFRKTPIGLSIGVEKTDGGLRVVSGPGAAVKKHAAFSVLLRQGAMQKSDCAKKILSEFEKKFGRKCVALDEIMSMLPNGGIEVKTVN
ncbi:MAG: DUF814 domain-containing protein [Candidatus Diapherotrites archaeon]|nr:DUF814 domain-containing protein [Candidatus Diapherotrites archaeon]